jgi:hypothetical protein
LVVAACIYYNNIPGNQLGTPDAIYNIVLFIMGYYDYGEVIHFS